MVEGASIDLGCQMKALPKVTADTFSFYEVFCEQHHLKCVPQFTIFCIYWSRLKKRKKRRRKQGKKEETKKKKKLKISYYTSKVKLA